jgi:hypothetical protein
MPETNRHRVVETFLAAVDDRLRRLQPARRAAERDELGQHLDLLVAAYRARGLDEDAAAAAALERFGRAERIAGDLADAWRRERKTAEYARFFVAYAGFIVVAYLALFWSMGDALPRHLPWVIALNALLLPSAFIYADARKRRKQTTK